MHNMPNDLRLVFWELTARCNLKCQHCRAEAQDCFVAGELTTDELIEVARDIRKDADPIMVLTGGEPLARPDFFELADECVKLFSRVALATNGTMVDDAMAKRIVDAGIQRVSISFDGATAKTHDGFRGVPGSFDAALRGFDALRRAGMSVQANVTVTKHNEAEVDDILQLMLEHGADAFHVFMLVPVGCGAELSEDVRLTPQRSEEILRWLFEKSLQYKDRIHMKATCAPTYFRIMREVAREKGIQLPTGGHPGGHPGGGHSMSAVTRGCLAGSGVCFVSRTGDVQPCGYLPVVVGNVRERTLGEIWRDSADFANLRDTDTLTGKCGVCGYRNVCQGCRARAYAQTGDYLTAEPDCTYMPPKAQEVGHGG